MHGEFFLTLLSACFQTAIACMSAIDTVLLQQTLGNNIIGNSDDLNTIQ
jgi:hypothetical protein